MWLDLIILATAGALGTITRFAVSGLAHRLLGQAYPWGTFAVNALGCLLFGLAWSITETRLHLSPQTRLFVLTGFMGAFTTFSTFAFETGRMVQDAQWASAGLNIAAHNLVGLAMIFAGFALGQSLE